MNTGDRLLLVLKEKVVWVGKYSLRLYDGQLVKVLNRLNDQQ